MVTRASRLTKIWLLICTILLVAVLTISKHDPSSLRRIITDIPTQLSARTLTCPRLSLSKHALPLTALASFPGSGNTWTRHLIQQMTGIATGAIYYDQLLVNNGFPREGTQNGSVIAIKTHKRYTDGYRKCVLIMRNPYEALIAEFNRYYTNDSHTASAKLKDFVREWDSFFEAQSTEYKYFYESWLEHSNMHLVLFNNLKDDLTNELEKLLKFLQDSTTLTGSVPCALKNRKGSAKRNHSRRLPYDFFYSKDQIQTLNKIISDQAHAYSRRYPEEVTFMEKWKM